MLPYSGRPRHSRIDRRAPSGLVRVRVTALCRRCGLLGGGDRDCGCRCCGRRGCILDTSGEKNAEQEREENQGKECFFHGKGFVPIPINFSLSLSFFFKTHKNGQGIRVVQQEIFFLGRFRDCSVMVWFYKVISRIVLPPALSPNDLKSMR